MYNQNKTYMNIKHIKKSIFATFQQLYPIVINYCLTETNYVNVL